MIVVSQVAETASDYPDTKWLQNTSYPDYVRSDDFYLQMEMGGSIEWTALSTESFRSLFEPIQNGFPLRSLLCRFTQEADNFLIQTKEHSLLLFSQSPTQGA